MQPTKRKSLGNSKRFKVFERDGYQCRYCGMRPPEVTLHVDHFIPVSKGGSNEISNLLTSCVSCNQGKKARIAVSPDHSVDINTQIEDRKEVLIQLKKLNKLNKEIEAQIDIALNEVTDHWDLLNEYRNNLNLRAIISLRSFLRHFSETQVKEAMELAIIQSRGHTDVFKYMCGILQNWKKGINAKPTNSYE